MQLNIAEIFQVTKLGETPMYITQQSVIFQIIPEILICKSDTVMATEFPSNLPHISNYSMQILPPTPTPASNSFFVQDLPGIRKDVSSISRVTTVNELLSRDRNSPDGWL